MPEQSVWRCVVKVDACYWTRYFEVPPSVIIPWVKTKFRPRTGHEGAQGKYRHSSTLSLTSAVDGSGWSTSRPGQFSPGNSSGTHFIGNTWARRRSGRVRKISPPRGFDTRTVQSVASRYTDWAIPDHIIPGNCINRLKDKQWTQLGPQVPRVTFRQQSQYKNSSPNMAGVRIAELNSKC